MRNIINGSRVPDILFGHAENDELRTVGAREYFACGRTLVLGAPGAFTPVCTKQHIPDFVQNADKLVASGFSRLVCIAPNDPFVLDAWARQLDPGKKLKFLSDGNLDFARALQLESQNRKLFLGWRSERYLMTVDDGIITRLRVEPSILTYSCTRATDALNVEFV